MSDSEDQRERRSFEDWRGEEQCNWTELKEQAVCIGGGGGGGA